MTLRKFHSLLGMVLLFPFLVWSLTGIFFLLRPAYPEAYAALLPRTYSLPIEIEIKTRPSWLETRLLRTVLGDHLLIRDDSGWHHLDPLSGRDKIVPPTKDLERLIEDAISVNPDRYGQIQSEQGQKFTTTTGVIVTLDWPTFSLYQQGKDTRWIDQIYALHYLRWTGIRAIDNVIGIVGLLLLIVMTATGFNMLKRSATAGKKAELTVKSGTEC